MRKLNQVESNQEISQFTLEIIKHLGGIENIQLFENCITRLRFQLKHQERMNEDGLRRVGVLAIYESGQELQLVVGSSIFVVADEIQRQINRA